MIASLLDVHALYLKAKHGDEYIAQSDLSCSDLLAYPIKGSFLKAVFAAPNLNPYAPCGVIMNLRGICCIPGGGAPNLGEPM